MPLNLRASDKFRAFSVPLSYRIGENRSKDRLFDAQNVFSNQGRLETRHGMSRLTSSAIGTGSKIISLSYFETEAGVRHVIAKEDTVLYSVNTSTGAATSIKTGLTASTKHRGVTVNGRHIIAIENDGLFFYDGTNFAALGEDPPSAPSVAAASGGSLTDSTYRVKITFYASSIGWETNPSAQSATVATSGSNNTISISSIASSATHPLIDKVRIYFSDDTNDGDFLFDQEINIGTTTATITEDATSTQVPPTKNAKPPAGGAKYLSKFNNRIAYTGNNNDPSTLYIGEPYLPDAVDQSGRGDRIYIEGDGAPTGVATGFYRGEKAFPYLVVFKKRSVAVVNDALQTTILSDQLGCVAPDSIRVINGDVYFLSAFGWRVVSNGQIVMDPQSLQPLTLGFGDIDDVFKSNGYERELNKADYSNMFSVYYSELDQYITFISEGANNAHNQAYVYEFESRGFKRYSFGSDFKAAVEGEDASGNNVIYLSDDKGFIYKHSIQENRTDVDSGGSAVNISAYAIIPWLFGDDLDASYNFREFIVHALSSSNDITVRTWINFTQTANESLTYSFPDPSGGFQLDVSKLDEDAFGDERAVVKARGDINRVGISLLLGFYQEVADGNMNLIRAQLDFSKNGNPN